MSRAGVATPFGDDKFHIGGVQAASDFTKSLDCILNCIKKNFTHGEDIANALEAREEINFNRIMPQLQEVTPEEAEDMEDAAVERHNKQLQSKSWLVSRVLVSCHLWFLFFVSISTASSFMPAEF